MSIKCKLFGHDYDAADVMHWRQPNDGGSWPMTLATYRCTRCRAVDQKRLDGHVELNVLRNRQMITITPSGNILEFKRKS